MLPLTALRTQIKWILGMFIVIFTASIGFMYGTGGSSGGSRSGDFVVAKVNGDEIRISTFQQQVRAFVERNNIRDLKDDQIPQLYKTVLDDMVANRAVINEVVRLKLNAPLEDVNAQYKQLESQYVTKEQFMQVLRQEGKTVDQFKAEIARELAIKKMLADAAGGAVATPEEVQKLYDTLKPQFTTPAGVEIDFAQFKTQESADKFIASVKADPDWNKATEAAGADVVQSSKDQHDLITEAQMVGNLAPIAGLKDGDITSIKLTDDAFLAVRRNKAVEETVKPLSEVEELLKSMILQGKRAELQQKFIKELTDKMKVEIVAEDLFTPKAKPEEAPKAEEAKSEAKPAETPKPEEAKPEMKPAEAPEKK